MAFTEDWKDLDAQQRYEARMAAWADPAVEFESDAVKQEYQDRVQHAPRRGRAQEARPCAHRPVDEPVPRPLSGPHGQGDVLRLRQAGRRVDEVPCRVQAGRARVLHQHRAGAHLRRAGLQALRLAGPRRGRGLGLPVQRGRVHEGRRVRPAHQRPVRLLDAVLPAARGRRARAVGRPRPVHRPGRGSDAGPVLHPLRHAAGTGDAQEDDRRRQRRHGVDPELLRPWTRRRWPRSACPGSPAA